MPRVAWNPIAYVWAAGCPDQDDVSGEGTAVVVAPVRTLAHPPVFDGHPASGLTRARDNHAGPFHDLR